MEIQQEDEDSSSGVYDRAQCRQQSQEDAHGICAEPVGSSTITQRLDCSHPEAGNQEDLYDDNTGRERSNGLRRAQCKELWGSVEEPLGLLQVGNYHSQRGRSILSSGQVCSLARDDEAPSSTTKKDYPGKMQRSAGKGNPTLGSVTQVSHAETPTVESGPSGSESSVQVQLLEMLTRLQADVDALKEERPRKKAAESEGSYAMVDHQ